MAAKREQRTMSLMCRLTDKEKLYQAEQMARFNNEASRLEDQAKAAATQFKNSIQLAEANFRKAADMVSSGVEYRDIKVREEMNLPMKGDKTIYREDTNEIVRVEMMEKDDYQLVLLRERQGANGETVIEAGADAEEPETEPGDEAEAEAEAETFAVEEEVWFREYDDEPEERGTVVEVFDDGTYGVKRAANELTVRVDGKDMRALDPVIGLGVEAETDDDPFAEEALAVGDVVLFQVDEDAEEETGTLASVADGNGMVKVCRAGETTPSVTIHRQWLRKAPVEAVGADGADDVQPVASERVKRAAKAKA